MTNKNNPSMNRRNFLKNCQLGMAGMALPSLTNNAFAESNVRQPHFSPKVKNVIYLHMAGSPPHLDLFDWKPELKKRTGQKCPAEFFDKSKSAFTKTTPLLLGSPREFAKCKKTGIWTSDAIPHLSSVTEELTVIKSMTTDQFNHSPAQYLLQTGFSQPGRPSLGSWVNYALGSENNDLPGFISLISSGKLPSAGKSIWGSGFMPSVYQGVRCRSVGDPVLYVSNPKGVDKNLRRMSVDLINQLNNIQHQDLNHPETLTRMKQYELAYRMQDAVPEVMDISKESPKVLEAYGAKPGTGSLANNCLLARKLVESGVRFVQLYDWGWDFHGTNPREDIRGGLTKKCATMDRPVAALIKDLKQRGLLDETLIVWGGEFGRTPFREGRTSKSKILGRDHYPGCFTMFMAGGGLKGGMSYGSSTPLGFKIAENKVHVHDLQATILHLLGFNHEKLTYRFQGRDFRLTEVHGHVVKGILA